MRSGGEGLVITAIVVPPDLVPLQYALRATPVRHRTPTLSTKPRSRRQTSAKLLLLASHTRKPHS